MELEEWLKKDMAAFIKKNAVPEPTPYAPLRDEEAKPLTRVDYDRKIIASLEQNRFNEAVNLFRELKERFKEIPLDHQEERKHFYHIMQKSYKLIHDYVDDRKKTARILDQLTYQANVFDENTPSEHVEQSAHKPKRRLFRKKAAPKPEPTEALKSMQTAAAITLAQEAQDLIQAGNLELAQEKILEARFETGRSGADKELMHRILDLEQQLAQQLTPQTNDDQQIFSSLYLQGLQALSAGDHNKARMLFQKRVQQAPQDRAARIRLQEVTEVLDGQSH